MVSTARGLDALCEGVRAGDRATLARAITLVESRRPEDRRQALALVSALYAESGRAQRIGISGVPGAGKSTLIEALGVRRLEQGEKVAVLAVDPSSTRSGGSILGDKTRMAELSRHPRAFVRPSPSGGALGGVARRTRELMVLCEAAGFDRILVETVGVGQSEARVAEMVDSFVLVLTTGAGDELQGIKRGVLELADMVVINKADGSNRSAAERARLELARSLSLFSPRGDGWVPPCLSLSALEGRGLDELWETLQAHRQRMQEGGHRDIQREEQRVRWLWDAVRDELHARLSQDPRLQAALAEAEPEVRAGRASPEAIAMQLVEGLLERRE